MTSDEIILRIKNNYPDIHFIDKSDPSDIVLSFRTDYQTEYSYEICIGLKTKYAVVHARLNGTIEKQDFWHCPFDVYGAYTDEEELNDCLEFIFEELDILTKFKTRITQKKNWISQSFTCEYLKENNWIIHYKHLALRTNFNFPEISGRQRIYE